MQPVWYIDKPNVSVPAGNAHEAFYAVSAWIAWPKDTLISDVVFDDPEIAAVLKLTDEPRPDVENAYPGMRARGFHASCPYDRIRHKSHAAASFTCSGKKYEVVFPTALGATGSFTDKSAKFDRISSILQCPNCQNGDLAIDPVSITCRGCNRTYRTEPALLDFTTGQISAAERDDSPQSANSYDPPSLNLMYKHHRGLVLDYGSGVRERYFDNVVNYEIHPNPSVDVIGDGTTIPFKDDSFDAVISLAVFEHVRDPFFTAREVTRVLKPGGQVYLQVPFLFHEHGYPNHFYNMTQAGMRNLFGGAIDVVDQGVLDYGQPICLLTIFLDHYVRGLPENVAAKFKKMRIEDFLAPYFSYLHNDYVTQLNEETKKKLACVNYMLAEKRPG